MKFFIGIDNGVTGGIGVLDTDGKLIASGKVPTKMVGDRKTIDLVELEVLLDDYLDDCVVYLEQGQKQPLFGCKGNYANGYYMGLVEGWMIAKGLPHHLVNPRTWQEVIFKDMRGYTKGKKNDTKSISLEVVSQRHPASKIKDNNITDAICIAMYAKFCMF